MSLQSIINDVHTVILEQQIARVQLYFLLQLGLSRSCEMLIASGSVLWRLWPKALSCPCIYQNSPSQMFLCLPLVDGSWNEWSAWSQCSTTCSNGTTQRTRECNGPSYGGSECHGSWKETANCFLKDCPGKKGSSLPDSLCKSKIIA